MKSTFLLLAASAGLVAAQNLTGEPDCAIPCLSAAIAAVCTPASDAACACASQGAIGQAGLSCLLSSCNGTELGQAQAAGARICSDFSATAISTATTPVPTGNSGSPSTTTPFSSGSAGVTATGAAPTGASATGASPSGASPTSTTPTTAARTTTPVPTTSATPTTASHASATPTSSAGANGANAMNGVMAAQAGLLGALLAGVAAVM